MGSGKFRHWIFPILALLLYLAALGLEFLFIESKQNHENFTRQINSRVDREINKVDEQITKVKKELEKKGDIYPGQLFSSRSYPYFIYKDKTLSYWSDNAFVPSYDQVNGEYVIKLLNLKKGQHLVRKQDLYLGDEHYEIIGLLPLYQNFRIDNKYIKSQFNTQIFSGQELTILTGVSSRRGNSIYWNDIFLFSVSYNPDYTYQDSLTSWLIFLLHAIAIGLFVYWLYIFSRRIIQNFYLGISVYVLGLLALRTWMIHEQFPRAIIKFRLFDPVYYASSQVNPSLGDLLLNEIAVLSIILIVFYNLFKRKTLKVPKYPWMSWFYSGLMIAFSFGGIYLNYLILVDIYKNSQFLLDVGTIVSFNLFNATAYLLFLINLIIYFLFTHLVITRFSFAHKIGFKGFVYLFNTISVVFILYSLIWEEELVLVFLSHALYFNLIYYYDLPKALNTVGYKTFTYFFLTAIVGAWLAAYSVFQVDQLKEKNEKQKFANQLLIENDILAEYLLSEVSQRIRDDAFIINQMYSPFLPKEVIIQKIKRVYLSSYFDKYDIKIVLFNNNGIPFDSRNRMNFNFLSQYYNQNQFRTEYPNLYFVNDISGKRQKQYLKLVEVERNNSTIGYVMIDLRLKKVVPNAVYPELLVDKRFYQSGIADAFNYAIYEGEDLIYSSGNFNYLRDIDPGFLEDPSLYKGSIVKDQLRHTGFLGENDKKIIISSPVYSIKKVMSNFSFYYLIMVLAMLLLVLAYTIVLKIRQASLNLSGKIQLYLNFAFFIPLLVVCVATIYLLTSSFKEENDRRYFNKAESIISNMVGEYDNFLRNQINKDVLSSNLSQIAKYAEADANLFGTDGELIVTSQPLIYENFLQAPFVNQEAFQKIRFQNIDQVILNESIGDLNYKTTYLAVKSFDSGELIGILGLPFFESKADLDRQIIQVFTNVMNIFTIIFIASIIISYFASKNLTHPLKMISDKMGRISLSEVNTPIKWNSDDEIGLLVKEYNKMIQKLEASKRALSQSEKESAWREMAKQVAHEIKNPLTPMKLTLQHLMRSVKDPDGATLINSDKHFKTLLNQIETLSDIATSFSAFAKMPSPKSEVVDLKKLIDETISLYENEAAITKKTGRRTRIKVNGDKKLLGRIFSNIILNGIQAVPDGEKPELEVAYEPNGKLVRIAFTDNGSGIPEDLREKIFVPNFSTKSHGSGIGLAIARRGVEQMGGTIWYETELGKGTSFYIELPIIED